MTMTETPVVTCFLRNAGEVLLLRRSAEVGSYRGQWGAVAGHMEGDPDEDALREIAEETGLREDVTLVRRGEPFAVEDEGLGRRWVVHPYLFDTARRDLRLDWESIEAAWVPPTEILRRPTVPQLWTSYERVAPSVEEIEDDHTHGSAYLSVRALEVLRDRAGLLAHREAGDAPEQLRSLARRLITARPAMTALANRVNRVMHACRSAAPGAYAACIEEAAHRALSGALAADTAAAEHAGGLIAGRRVLTLSRSGTVTRALLAGGPAAVFVAVSRPGGEGVGMARALSGAGLSVALVPDAALASVVTEQDIDVVLVGADAVLPSGAVVNKVGTRAAALGAWHAGIPFYAITARDKVSAEDEPVLEAAPPDAGDPDDLDAYRPLFEVTPESLITGLVMEDGLHTPGEVASLADRVRTYAEWQPVSEKHPSR